MTKRDDARTIAVIGAGAAGLMAALFAGRSGADVVLIERTGDGGRKILISGGGRCNILPSVVQPERYVTASSPNSLKKMLLSWPLSEQREFFERELEQQLLVEAETGKIFLASNRARDVRDGLLRSVHEAGVSTWFDALVTDIKPPTDLGSRWSVVLDGAPPLEASAVVIATGGLSVPATGSDGTGLRVGQALGHTMHDTYPALTPLTADPAVHAHLAGVSLDVTLRCRRERFETSGGFLFTHRGYSGPTVLDASHLATRARGDSTEGKQAELTVQWTSWDAAIWDESLRVGTGSLGGKLGRHLPDRLAVQIMTEAAVDPGTSLAQLPRDARRTLVTLLADYPLPWTGDEGYKKAEVTGGGVSLAEVDPRSMESRRHPGLYFCGEVLDAFGPIGGHNFLWAWATGRAAGVAAGVAAGAAGMAAGEAAGL
jgi:predicted Rossmann fold flavoprotein